MVGMNWHCFSVVVTWPKIVDMMLPDPVSAIAVSVVGPCGLMSERGLQRRAARLAGGQVHPGDISGSFCSAAGPGVPIAVNT